MKRVHGLSDQEHYDRKLYPVLTERSDKFPDGESLDDLADRAEKAVDELLFPFLFQALKEGKSGVHIAVVSHGLCISELVAALTPGGNQLSKPEKGKKELCFSWQLRGGI